MATIRVGRLTQPGDVYVGVEDIDSADFNSTLHIPAAEFGGACDLPPDKYYWHRVRKTFLVLQNLLDQPPAPTAPSALVALAVALIGMWRRREGQIPHEVTDWLDFYVMSVDFPRRIRRTRPVRYYIQQRGLAIIGSPL